MPNQKKNKKKPKSVKMEDITMVWKCEVENCDYVVGKTERGTGLETLN